MHLLLYATHPYIVGVYVGDYISLRMHFIHYVTHPLLHVAQL